MSTYAKNFIALESDPEIFTDLMHSLGVKRSVRIIDIWSLDEDALAFVPRPVLALILVLPPGMRGEDEEGETKSEGKGKVEDERKGGENIVWFKQTIHNACGLYALLHGVCNNPGIIGTFPSSLPSLRYLPNHV